MLGSKGFLGGWLSLPPYPGCCQGGCRGGLEEALGSVFPGAAKSAVVITCPCDAGRQFFRLGVNMLTGLFSVHPWKWWQGEVVEP